MESLRRLLRNLAAFCVVVLLFAALIYGWHRLTTEPTDEHGMTALMRAARDGDTARVRALIADGAKVNARVPRNDLQAFIAFISWMQQIPHRDDDWTPLLYAVRGGHVETAKVLLEAGADPMLKGRGDIEDVLALAVFSRDPEMLALMLGAVQGKGPEAQASLDHALFGAVGQGDVVMLRMLIAAGADVNGPVRWLRTSEPLSPLLVAARNGNADVVPVLLDHGADVHVRDQRGWTPLAWAVDGRHEAVAAMLRSAGATEDLALENALLDAIRRGDLPGVEAALSAGANPNQLNQYGDFALMRAADSGDAAIVRALLAGRANPNQRHEYMGTPLTAAATKGNPEVVRLLLAAGARPRDPKEAALARAAHYGHLEVVRMLLAAGADVNWGGGEALRASAWQGRTEIVQALLDARANPNLKDASGMTALVRASGSGHLDIVQLLLGHGADPNLADDIGNTPLTFAAALGHTEIVKTLLAAGADPNRRDSDEKTALHYARKHGDSEMEQALRGAGARD